MKINQTELEIHTDGRGTLDITKEVNQVIQQFSAQKGVCHLFLQHTSASLIVCENYDKQVRLDLERFLNKLIPDGSPLFKHTSEGEDDMPAHIRTILTQTSLTIPIQEGALALGTWQGIYLYEHRYRAHTRQIIVTLMSL